MPVAKLENGNWPHPARLPLGCGWSGHCTAPDHENEVPAQDVLETFCNLGYASGCAWSPAKRVWDIVRFAVIAPALNGNHKSTTAGDGSHILHLSYVCERNHLPAEHGKLEFDLSQSRWLSQHSDARIQKMADCFLESYLKKQI
jgi:hypothetical protein